MKNDIYLSIPADANDALCGSIESCGEDNVQGYASSKQTGCCVQVTHIQMTILGDDIDQPITCTDLKVHNVRLKSK